MKTFLTCTLIAVVISLALWAGGYALNRYDILAISLSAGFAGWFVARYNREPRRPYSSRLIHRPMATGLTRLVQKAPASKK